MIYPRTLVVCESPPSSTQGYGVTLATLVRNWPEDKLFVFYRSSIYKDDTLGVKRAAHAPMPGRLIPDAISYLRGQRPAWQGRYSRKWLENTLNNWRPEVIYGFFYDASIPRYLEWLSQVFECPYVVHIGDDNPSLTAGRDIPGIFQRAGARIAISEEMAIEYRQRYDAPFDVLHNGAADELFSNAGGDTASDGALVVRYIGSLLREQHWHAIEDFVEAVRHVNRNGQRVRFEIYCDKWTGRLAEELADGEHVVYAGFAAKPRNYQLLQSADLLFLPVTFSEEHLERYRFSMPTKLCEYLASGTPTLVYGPRGPAVVELCVRNNVALVQSERSVSDLIHRLETLIDDRGAYQEAATKDREFAKAQLSAESMSMHFQGLMCQATGISHR
jgi:glycosyltransferase involved in cell wall biosynthesis